DTSRPEVSGDRERKWMADQRGRAFRGKTPAGRKARGLTRKGRGAEKIRPSIRAKGGRGK
ncbi:MAG: 50S ribosomal protein L15e, partial [Candidatus Aenigmarchaeota archaeon]|nr:50S ribosomal protein L15e [Candidatus Aenigmarchaeota archaeon]